jgi:hypothetical protein
LSAPAADEELLYHYTSPAGVMGILEGRCIWATDAMFLNDAAEVSYAQGRMLARLAEQHQYDESPWLREILDVTSTLFAPGQSGHLYLTSFCQAGDLLSQWRGYAGGGGYAIGFSSRALSTTAVPGAEVRLVKVRYGPEEARPRLRPIFDSIVAHGPYGEDERRHLVLDVLAPELAAAKDPAFAEEQEWRLMVVGHTDRAAIRYRLGAAAIVPYVEIGLPGPDAVREVVVGPGGTSDLRRAGLASLLEHYGYRDTPVHVSSAPLRF